MPQQCPALCLILFFPQPETLVAAACPGSELSCCGCQWVWWQHSLTRQEQASGNRIGSSQEGLCKEQNLTGRYSAVCPLRHTPGAYSRALGSQVFACLQPCWVGLWPTGSVSGSVWVDVEHCPPFSTAGVQTVSHGSLIPGRFPASIPPDCDVFLSASFSATLRRRLSYFRKL